MPEDNLPGRWILSSRGQDPEPTAVSVRFAGQRQTETGLAQEVDGIVAKEGKKTVIGQVAAETPAGLRPVMVDFAGEFFISLLQENTPLLIRVDHKDQASLFCLLGGGIDSLLPDGLETDINTDMPSHLRHESDLIGLQGDLTVFFTACPALAAIVEDGI
jgi:hypothetical protein